MFDIITDLFKYGVIALFFFIIASIVRNSNLNDEKLRSEIAEMKKDNYELRLQLNIVLNNFSILTSLSDEQKKELEAYKIQERIIATNDDVEMLKELIIPNTFERVSLYKFKNKQESENKNFEDDISDLKEYMYKQISRLDNYLLALFAALIAVFSINLYGSRKNS